jgi:pimeloyl-ACP methyl ester carboxylesterase
MLQKLKELFYIAPRIHETRNREHFHEQQIQLKNGIIINYAEAGSGKLIVFLHGLANNWETWIPVSMHLMQKYHVVLLDLPGYGKSTHLKEYSLQALAGMVAEFIGMLPEKPAAVVGLSLGSQLATTLLHNYSAVAESVVLNGPIFKIHDIGHINDFFTERIHDLGYVRFLLPPLRLYIKNTPASYLTSKYLNYYKFDRNLLDSYTRSGKYQVDPLAWLQLSGDAAELKQEELLRDVKVPVLLIFGDHDNWTSTDGARKLMQGSKTDITYVTVKDSGHSVSIEKSAEVAAAIGNFLTSKIQS